MSVPWRRPADGHAIDRLAAATLMQTGGFFEDSFARLLEASPEVAAELGVRAVGSRALPMDRLSDLSPQGDARRQTLMAQTLADLQSLPAAAAGSAEALDRRIYEFFLRWAYFGRLRGTESGRFTACDYLADHLDGAQSEMLTCLAQWQPLDSPADAQAYVGRVAAIPGQIEGLIEGLRARIDVGNIMPACIVARVAGELERQLAVAPLGHPIHRRLAGTSWSGSADMVAGLTEREVYPALRRLLEFLHDEYPRERRVGLCRMPDGEGYYEFLLQARTTTGWDARRIHCLGKEELQRLQEELDQKLRTGGYAGETLTGRLAAFNADVRFRHGGDAGARQRLLESLETIVESAQAGLMPLFGIRPRAGLVVRPIPELQEANRHTVYAPPAADGSRPGIFEVNAGQLLAQNRLSLYTVAYHEAFPGHHLQLTIAQELGSALPAFRRILVHDAYIEGWAKYAELLPALEGFNTDPHWAIMRSHSELVSTANLVLDTGIHSQDWSRAQGIAFLIEQTGAGAQFAESLTDRIIARPAQSCAYKIGLMSVLGARHRMQRALGSRFDVRRFHDIVLGSGSVPLLLMDELIDAEITRAMAC